MTTLTAFWFVIIHMPCCVCPPVLRGSSRAACVLPCCVGPPVLRLSSPCCVCPPVLRVSSRAACVLPCCVGPPVLRLSSPCCVCPPVLRVSSCAAWVLLCCVCPPVLRLSSRAECVLRQAHSSSRPRQEGGLVGTVPVVVGRLGRGLGTLLEPLAQGPVGWPTPVQVLDGLFEGIVAPDVGSGSLLADKGSWCPTGRPLLCSSRPG